MYRLKFVRLFTCVVLAALAFQASTALGAPGPSQANAFELLTSAQRAVGQLVVIAEKEPAFKSREGKSKPFWDGLRTANDNLANAATSAKLQSDKFTEHLAASLAAVEQADIARIMNGGGSMAMAEQTEQLQKIVMRLNENYGPYAARQKAGGNLTEKEKAQLEKLKAQQAELETKLAAVEKNIGKNNKEIQKGIDRIRKNSRKIRGARNNVSGFVGGFWAAHIMSGYLWGWHWWWGPWGVWCPGYVDINVDIWLDGWSDLDYEWDLLDLEYDVEDLGLDSIDISDAELAESEASLLESEYILEDGDMADFTEGLPAGWDDVSTDAGAEAMDQMESNFDQTPFDRGAEIEAIDYGTGDFGGDFGGGDFGGGDFGGGDFGGGDF